MTNEIYESWTLDLTSPEQSRDAIETEFAPTGDIRILTEESPEESDSVYIEDSLFGVHLPDWMDSISDLLKGESTMIEANVSDIKLTPKEEQNAVEVYVDLRGVPDDVRNYEPDLIEMEAFVQEVYRTGASWAEEAKAINPEITDVDWYQDLETALADAREAMEDAGIPVEDSP